MGKGAKGLNREQTQGGKFSELSPKQKRVMSWWRSRRGWDALICDGAVRSGKTICMGLSFFDWAMARFDGQAFALCGKTIESVRRNLLRELLPVLRQRGFECEQLLSRNQLNVSLGERQNIFYLFGGKDESSADLIQGLTLAGVLLDEVVLMPRSFVEQACARCSVEGAKVWFSCNPEGPQHWFYKEWICRTQERNALYLHFTMKDNPSLSDKVRKRYEQMFKGTFYRRFVLGEWVAAEGLVYDFFREESCPESPEGEMERWCISCDYGTVNPASFGLWGLRDGVWYRVKEYYYDSKLVGRQMTDGEYAQKLAALAAGRDIWRVVVDPSAASFIEVLRRAGWRVTKAKNDVLSGVRITAELLRCGKLVICRGCADAIREFGLYRWEEDGTGDRVRKQDDHAMDDIRYFAATVVEGQGAQPPVFAGSVSRRSRM